MAKKKATATKKYIWSWDQPQYTTAEKAAATAGDEYGAGKYTIYEIVGTAEVKNKTEIKFKDK